METNNPTINFNAPIINNGGTITGDIHYHNGYKPAEASLLPTEQKVRDALLMLLTMKDEEGNAVMRFGYQWYGIYRVLSEFCGYPEKMTDFERVVTNMSLGEVDVPCVYDNFRRVPTQCSRLARPNVWLWRNYVGSASEKEHDIIAAAMKMMDLLGICQ